MSAQTSAEVSLLGVGTVLRLERDASPMVKLLRQATNEYPPPPPAPSKIPTPPPTVYTTYSIYIINWCIPQPSDFVPLKTAFIFSVHRSINITFFFYPPADGEK